MQIKNIINTLIYDSKLANSFITLTIENDTEKLEIEIDTFVSNNRVKLIYTTQHSVYQWVNDILTYNFEIYNFRIVSCIIQASPFSISMEDITEHVSIVTEISPENIFVSLWNEDTIGFILNQKNKI